MEDGGGGSTLQRKPKSGNSLGIGEGGTSGGRRGGKHYGFGSHSAGPFPNSTHCEKCGEDKRYLPADAAEEGARTRECGGNVEVVEGPLPGDNDFAWVLADVFRLDPLLARHVSVEYTPGSEHLGECWLWTGATQKSKRRSPAYWYGKLKRARNGIQRTWCAHRYVYCLLLGNPAWGEVHHECRNPKCINPNHLSCLNPVAHALYHTTYRPIPY